MPIQVVETRSRYIERIRAHRGEPAPAPSRVSNDTSFTSVRAMVKELARRFAHRNPRRIPNGLSFESDMGEVQTVRWFATHEDYYTEEGIR
jgi:hypothetical protein